MYFGKPWLVFPLVVSVVLCASCSKPPPPKPAPVATATQADPANSAVTLRAGSAAPALDVQKWVTGEPVSKFRPGHVYVVEFWATWCKPCVDAMPHLTELARQFRDRVTFIGVNIEGDADGIVETVEKFVAKQGDRVGYAIAIDTAANDMQRNWLEASGSDGIPQSFVIDGAGKVAWIGHPNNLREILDAVLAGKAVAVPDRKAEMAEVVAKTAPMREALKKKDFATALTHIDGLLQMPYVGFQFAPLKFQVLAESVGDAKAYEYAKEILAGTPPESKAGRDWTLLMIGDAILTGPLQERDYALALRLVQEAVKSGPTAEGGHSQSILARATYLAGNKDEGRQIADHARKLIEQDGRMPEDFKKQCLDQLAELK